jgi:DUF1680 family protein
VLASPGTAGPAAPTLGAVATQRPLTGSGARLTAGLVYDWQRRNASASMPLALRQLEVAGNLDNVRLAIRAPADGAPGDGAPGDGAPADGAPADGARAGGDGRRPRRLGLGPVDPLPGTGYRGPVFMDSDIYKTLEAVGWELAHAAEHPQPALADFAASTIELLAQAQRPDGYLNSYVQVSGEPRYARLAWSHEMYCAGHLIQAAIGLHRGAGRELASTARLLNAGRLLNTGQLLGVATRLADHLVREFAGRERSLDGHPIIETALVELYRETGTLDYLNLAQQFVNQRGFGLAGDSGMGRRYLQDHLPVRESSTEVGHVVRALYLEAGVVDVAVETHDDELLQSSIRRWDDMVATKTYLTGGNGSRHMNEGFGDRFELPPDRAYNETCAAIASFQWSWRLLLATGDAKYADHMERVLYNGFAAAVSGKGDRFFYVNPLQRREDHFEKDDPGRRRVWFSCACCPPNIMRLFASVEHYLATTDDDTLYLQQYLGARLAGAGLDLEIVTDYPWSGQVTVRVLAAPQEPRGLAMRIPAWSANTSVKINHFSERTVVPDVGYLRLHQEWRPGDEIVLHLDMTPRWAYPDRRVDAVRGCAAVERGPLVYCAEQADHLVRLDELAIRPGARLTEHEVTLDGIGRTIEVTVAARHVPPPPGQAVARVSAATIPYFQWDNRGAGAMRVWLPGA